MKIESRSITSLKSFDKGEELVNNGQFDQAIPYFFTSAKESEKNMEWATMAMCFEKIAYCYEAEGEFRKAALDYDASRAYFEKAKLVSNAKNMFYLASENIKKYFQQNIVKVIGVVGLNGSGKDEIVKRLQEKFDIPLLSTGEITRELAKENKIEPTRENLHNITLEYWSIYGKDYFPYRIAIKVIEKEWKIAGWTGIRPPSDVKRIKELMGDGFMLVNVEISDPKVRFERLSKRAEGRDPKKFEDFLKQDRSENEIFHLNETISMANYSMKNDGSLEDLHKNIDKFAKDILHL